MLIIKDLWICVDCAVFHAVGAMPEDIEAAARVQAGVEREAAAGGAWGLEGPTEDEDEEAVTREFSRAACACCYSTLGGSRHRAALIYPGEAAA